MDVENEEGLMCVTSKSYDLRCILKGINAFGGGAMIKVGVMAVREGRFSAPDVLLSYISITYANISAICHTR